MPNLSAYPCVRGSRTHWRCVEQVQDWVVVQMTSAVYGEGKIGRWCSSQGQTAPGNLEKSRISHRQKLAKKTPCGANESNRLYINRPNSDRSPRSRQSRGPAVRWPLPLSGSGPAETPSQPETSPPTASRACRWDCGHPHCRWGRRFHPRKPPAAAAGPDGLPWWAAPVLHSPAAGS